jgi:hypothetical protein
VAWTRLHPHSERFPLLDRGPRAPGGARETDLWRPPLPDHLRASAIPSSPFGFSFLLCLPTGAPGSARLGRVKLKLAGDVASSQIHINAVARLAPASPESNPFQSLSDALDSGQARGRAFPARSPLNSHACLPCLHRTDRAWSRSRRTRSPGTSSRCDVTDVWHLSNATTQGVRVRGVGRGHVAHVVDATRAGGGVPPPTCRRAAA